MSSLIGTVLTYRAYVTVHREGDYTQQITSRSKFYGNQFSPVSGILKINIVGPDTSLVRGASRDGLDGVEERSKHIRVVVRSFILVRGNDQQQ